jgi:hypothetical protein
VAPTQRMGMEQSVGIGRHVAETLVSTVEEMLAQLAGTSAGDTSWLRPLAVLCAELEYSVVRSRRFDPVTVSQECLELSHLLARSPTADGTFTSRYVLARRASASIAILHDRALAACRTVVTHAEWAA